MKTNNVEVIVNSGSGSRIKLFVFEIIGDVNEGMDCTNVALAGNLGPKSIKFVSAEHSPTETPLLIIGNEVSGTVTVY